MAGGYEAPGRLGKLYDVFNYGLIAGALAIVIMLLAGAISERQVGVAAYMA